MAHDVGLFPTVLRHWRSRRGYSQLDLAVAAEVSARHISFLETGRSQPSRDMVLRLGETLEVPLRDVNSMLHAAGFAHAFDEPSFDGGLPAPLVQALDRMAEQQEPYPLAVMNRRYDVLRTNRAAMRILRLVIAEPAALPSPLNIMQILFEPRLARGAVVEWDKLARSMLSRLHREVLARPSDTEVAALLRSLLERPDVPKEWRQPDLSTPSEPTLIVRLRYAGSELAFLTTLTVFNAPQNVTLEEVRIESYFPFDERTVKACTALAAEEAAGR